MSPDAPCRFSVPSEQSSSVSHYRGQGHNLLSQSFPCRLNKGAFHMKKPHSKRRKKKYQIPDLKCLPRQLTASQKLVSWKLKVCSETTQSQPWAQFQLLLLSQSYLFLPCSHLCTFMKERLDDGDGNDELPSVSFILEPADRPSLPSNEFLSHLLDEYNVFLWCPVNLSWLSVWHSFNTCHDWHSLCIQSWHRVTFIWSEAIKMWCALHAFFPTKKYATILFWLSVYFILFPI